MAQIYALIDDTVTRRLAFLGATANGPTSTQTEPAVFLSQLKASNIEIAGLVYRDGYNYDCRSRKRYAGIAGKTNRWMRFLRDL